MKHNDDVESLVTKVSIGTARPSFVVAFIMGKTFDSVVIVSAAATVSVVDTTVSVGDAVSTIPVLVVVVLAVNTKFLGAANLVVILDD